MLLIWMNSPMQNDPFNLLHRRVQKWCANQGWVSLRDIQKESIKPVLAKDRDVIIAASTSAGKTEAAFLPACSSLVEADSSGVGIITPLICDWENRPRQILGTVTLKQGRRTSLGETPVGFC